MELAIADYENILEGLEIQRHATLKKTLANYAHLFRGKHVLDYGASRGLSAVAMVSLGAASVFGIEPDADRVETGAREIAQLGLSDRIKLIQQDDTTRLSQFEDGAFDFILSNAVFEHIPQPRRDNLREVWRMLAPGGHFLLTETPNKYWPHENHTTGLWFNHWLPESLAYRRANLGRLKKISRSEWKGSGWRGLGYFEMVAPLDNYRLIPENSRPRHRVLSALGIPASILDPYPDWLLQKVA